jgi:cytidylate kinase
MTVITISRQYGSWGDEVAAHVGKLLGYRSFDKRLMAEVALDLGVAPHEIVDFSEDTYKVRNFLDRLLGGQPRHVPVTARSNIDTEQTTALSELDETFSLNLIQAILEVAYQRGNVVIVGRGGQAFLKERPGVLHVRIIAPHRVRVHYLHDRANFSWGGGKEAIIQHDRASAEYLQRFYDLDWADPAHYDLVINMGKLDIDGATQHIVDAVDYIPVADEAVSYV